jgi:hypothetical protein
MLALTLMVTYDFDFAYATYDMLDGIAASLDRFCCLFRRFCVLFFHFKIFGGRGLAVN